MTPEQLFNETADETLSNATYAQQRMIYAWGLSSLSFPTSLKFLAACNTALLQKDPWNPLVPYNMATKELK